eukprot:gene4700-8284_t
MSVEQINIEGVNLTYKEDLWDCYPQISKRFVTSLANLGAVISFFKEQAAAEDKVAKQTTKASLDIDPTMGAIVGPCNSLVKFAQDTGKVRTLNSLEVAKKYVTDLTSLQTEVSKQLKMADKEESRLRKEYEAANGVCLKAKEKDIECKKNFEKLQIDLLQAKGLKPKQLQKLQASVNTAEKNSKKAEADYKASVEKQNKTRDHYFLALGGLMSVMEALDKKRIDILKKTFLNYAALQATFIESLETGVSVLEQSFSAINPEGDVQEYILKTKSDKKRPPTEVFEPMSCKIQQELTPEKYSNDLLKNAKKYGSSVGFEGSGGSNPRSSSATDVAIPSGLSSSPSGKQEIEVIGDQPVIKVVTAIYEYEPQNEEELALKPGDIVDVTEMTDDWWIGKLNGKMGIFPSNFVQDYDPNAPVVLAENGEGEEVAELLGIATAIYPYDPQEPTELPFEEGAQIEVYHMGEDGWWQGMLNGKMGLFPSNFVEFNK